MRLDRLKKGHKARITMVHGEAGLRRSLLDLGLTPNTIVMVRKVAPLGDPIVVSLRGFELSLRKGEAARVEVTEISGDSSSAPVDSSNYREARHGH